jgi:hypothetical protein
VITSWQPLDDAPWDAGTALYVRKAPHVVVAGLAGDSALVDQTLPIARRRPPTTSAWSTTSAPAT